MALKKRKIKAKNRKNPVRKSSSIRHSGKSVIRKKKIKVNLDRRSVISLTSIVLSLSAAFLAIGFFFSSPKNPKNKENVFLPVPETPSVNSVEENISQKPSPIGQKEKDIQKIEKASRELSVPLDSKSISSIKDVNDSSIEAKKSENKSVNAKNDEVKKSEIKSDTSDKSSRPSKETNEKSSSSKKDFLDENQTEKYDIPQAQKGATLVFIIDDAGYSVENLKKYTALPFPLAIAVIPKLPHSSECASIIRSSKKEVMLHQPMQAQNLSLNPGEGALLPSMSLEEIYSQVMENITEISPISGMNNHEGSLITSDLSLIGAVLDAVRDSGIYFVDSRTTSQTVVPVAAQKRGMHIIERDVFIDDIISHDEMLKEIYRGISLSNKNGKAVLIGHVDKSVKILPDLLSDLYPELKKKGYIIAFPSSLLG